MHQQIYDFFTYIRGDMSRNDVRNHEGVCKYTNDQYAYNDAVISQDISVCGCIEDMDLRDMCYDEGTDIMLYMQAVEHVDEDMCYKISDETQQLSCVTVVQENFATLQDKDPVSLASILSYAHNERAIDVYESLYTQHPENTSYAIALALSYAEKALHQRETGDDYQALVVRAKEVLDTAQDNDSNNTEVYRARGYVYEVQSSFDAALKSYDVAIAHDAHNALAYAGRGHVYRSLGDYTKAMQEFKNAAAEDADHTHMFIYTNMCNLAFVNNSAIDVDTYCHIVIDKQDVDPLLQSEAYQILALYHMHDDVDDAYEYALQAKALAPHNADVYVTLARIAIKRGDDVVAVQYIQDALNISPYKTMAFFVQSQILYDQGKYAEAMASAQKGLDVAERDASLLNADKRLMMRDLYYTIANCYNNLDDVKAYHIYKEKGDNVVQEQNMEEL